MDSTSLPGHLVAVSGRLNWLNTNFKAHRDDPVIHITQQERYDWNGKYDFPTTGIPMTDLDSWVQQRILEGKAAHVFSDTDHLDTWLATGLPFPIGESDVTPDMLNIGDDLYTLSMDEPDYWWDGITRQTLRTETLDLSGYSLKGHQHVKIDITDWDHTHPMSDITGLSLDWSAIENKPTTWAWDDITGKPDVSIKGHDHTVSDINNLNTWTGSGSIVTIGTLVAGSVPWARITNAPMSNTDITN